MLDCASSLVIPVLIKDQDAITTMDSVSSFAGLTDVNIAFLEGKLPRSPYYYEAVYTVGNSEHGTYAQNLIELNRFGFYTMDSQPSASAQRNYLCGILPTPVADQLACHLLEKHNQGRYHCECVQPDGTQKGCYLYDPDSVFFAKINFNPVDRDPVYLLPYDAQHKDLGETERYYARKNGKVFSKTVVDWEKLNESAYDTYHDLCGNNTCSIGIDSHGSFCMQWITHTADECLGVHPPNVVDLLKENYSYMVIISQLETGIAVENLLLDFYHTKSARTQI